METALITPPSIMNLSEKLARLQVASNTDSMSAFGELIGVNPTTLRRIELRGDATERILTRIANAFENVTPEMLSRAELELPDEPVLSWDKVLATKQQRQSHEGRQLAAYLDDLGRGSRARLSETMGVSPPQIKNYEVTERFQANVKASILAGLGVKEEAVFKKRYGAGAPSVTPDISLLMVPLLKPNRRQINANELLKLQSEFSPVVHPGQGFPVDPKMLQQSPEDLIRSLAVEVTTADNMAPRYLPGAILLAVRVESDKWDELDNTVAIMTGGKIAIRSVYSNQLRANNTIEVGPFERGAGSSVVLRRKDIQLLFRITHILLSPA